MAGRRKRAEGEDWRARKSPYPGVYPSGPDSWYFKLRRPRDPRTGEREQVNRGGFPTDREAHEARLRLQLQWIEGVATRREDETLGEYLTRWVEGRHDVKPSTRVNYRRMILRYINPHIGHLKLAELDADHVADWLAALAASPSRRKGADATRRLGPSAINEARTLLVSALHLAVARRRIPYNPAALVPPIRRERRRPKVWDDDEIAKFLLVADNHELAAWWRLALFAQLRPGELAALRWENVDLARARLWINATRTKDEDGGMTMGDSPKTAASRRWVTLPASCLLALRRHRIQQNERRLAYGLGSDWNPLGLVFPSQRGDGMIAHSTICRHLDLLCEAAGVTRLTPHGLRHTGATWLARLRESPRTISQRLGHASVKFTLDNYIHPTDADDQAAADRLGNAEGSLGEPRTGTG